MTRVSLGLDLQLTTPDRFRSNFPPLLLRLAGLCLDQILRRRYGIARHVDNTHDTVSCVAQLFLHFSFAAEAVSRRSMSPFDVQYRAVSVTAKLNQVSRIETRAVEVASGAAPAEDLRDAVVSRPIAPALEAGYSRMF